MSTPYTGKREHYGQREPVKKYFTAEETAKILGTTKAMVYYWRDKIKRTSPHADKYSFKEIREMIKIIQS